MGERNSSDEFAAACVPCNGPRDCIGTEQGCTHCGMPGPPDGIPPRERLIDLAAELEQRSEALMNRWAPEAARREERIALMGDAGIMEYAATVIRLQLDYMFGGDDGSE